MSQIAYWKQKNNLKPLAWGGDLKLVCKIEVMRTLPGQIDDHGNLPGCRLNLILVSSQAYYVILRIYLYILFEKKIKKSTNNS